MLRLTESSISKLMPMLPRQTELEAVTRVEKFAVGAELGDFFHLIRTRAELPEFPIGAKQN